MLWRAITAAFVVSGLPTGRGSGLLSGHCYRVGRWKGPRSSSRTCVVRTCSPEAKEAVRKALMSEEVPLLAIKER